MKIFDTHTHIFPHKIAVKASGHISEFYDVPTQFDGSVEQLLQMMDANGISKCLVLSAATTVEQVAHINDFIHEQVCLHPDRFEGLFTLHPQMNEENLAKEFDRATAMGLKGIKLHPDFQQFAIDDPCAYPIYELAQQKGIPILFHTGDKRYSYSNPHRLARVLDDFKHLIAIGAHFGGWSEWDDACAVLKNKENLFVDTSSTRAFLPLDTIKKCVSTFGTDRMLFGTDYPMWDAKDEIPFIDRLGLTETEKEKVLYKNAYILLPVT